MKLRRKSKIQKLISFDRDKGSIVIGTDEAGRGPMAGPVTAAAVYFPEFTPEVIEAVEFALSYVNDHNIKHWWVDLSTSVRGLKETDQTWVETEFGKAIAESSLTKLAMTPPLPETGQNIDWIDKWESDTNARYRGKIEARLVQNKNDVRAHFI